MLRAVKRTNQRDTGRTAPCDGGGRGELSEELPVELRAQLVRSQEGVLQKEERASAKACSQAPETPDRPGHAFLFEILQPETSTLCFTPDSSPSPGPMTSDTHPVKFTALKNTPLYW